MGTFGYMFDVPLMIIAVLVFGGKFGARTVQAALSTAGFMDILTRPVYPNEEAGHSLGPVTPLGGRRRLSNALRLAC